MVAAVVPAQQHGIYSLSPDGVLSMNLHAGQQRAYWSDARFTLVLAGTQSGKTTVGPAWLFRKIQKNGPGDYLVGSPTFPLMELKVIPEFKRFFMDLMDLGTYVGSPLRKFTVSRRGNDVLFGTSNPGEETHVYFGYGSDPDSLESATFKGAWLDEAGQRKFKRASWEAILRRLSISEGPVLITTTPYGLGWLKAELHDRAATDPNIVVINFPSIANPRFRRSEWERAKRDLPAWKFNMFYGGRFDRPAGLIYGNFDRAIHTMPRFTIPDTWPRFIGLDFGGVNTAAILFAEEQSASRVPSGRYIGYREYHAGGRTAKQHAASLLQAEPRVPTAVGGSKSEGQWRQEFADGGLSVYEPPISDVEVGIDRVYAGLNAAQFILFDDLVGTLDQVESYSRPLDERGEPMEGIEDKAMYHFCFVAGTEIATEHGLMPVEHVRPGVRVHTRFGLQPVEVQGSRPGERVMTVELSNGVTLTGTHDHPIWLPGRGWVSLDALRYNDTVYFDPRRAGSCAGKPGHLKGLRTTGTPTPNANPIAGISNARASYSIVPYGRQIMGRFLKAITSTTRMAIRRTTTSRTWKPLLRACMSATIMQGDPHQPRRSILTGFDRWPASGIDRMLVASGIVSTRIGLLLGVSSGITPANSAGPASSRKQPRIRRAFARMHVRRLIAMRRALTTRNGSARSVVQRTCETNTRELDTVPVHVVRVRELHDPHTVYNLSVAHHHEYFANGVLVSNCDAWRYIASYLVDPVIDLADYYGSMT